MNKEDVIRIELVIDNLTAIGEIAVAVQVDEQPDDFHGNYFFYERTN